MADFWRKKPPVMDETGTKVLKGGLWPFQREWWEAETFYRTLITGYGGGKTLTIAKWGISCALQNAPVPHLIVSPSYKIAKRTIIPTLKGLLAGKQRLLRRFNWRFLRTDHEFHINYHGRMGLIWVASGDDPLSLRGPNVGTAAIDEPFIQDREVFDQVVARVREPAKIQAIGLSGTPEELNFGYDICEGEEADNYDMTVIQASTRDNKALPSDYADRLEGTLTEQAARAYIDGKFVSLATGKIYYGFSDENIKKIEIPEDAELGAGMDFNVNPMAACVFWKFKDKIHFFDEIELANSDTQYMCSYLREKYGNRLTTIYPDATGKLRHSNAPGGKTDFHYIREAGFRMDVGPSNPPIRDRYNTVNGNLKPKEGEPRITIDPDCKKMIAYMKQLTHEKKKKLDHMTHLMDARDYPVCRLMPITRVQSIGRLHGA